MVNETAPKRNVGASTGTGGFGSSSSDVSVALNDLLEKLCELFLEVKPEEGPSLLECLATIKANTAAITGIETSLGQVGCIEDDAGNQIGTVLVCKVSDTTTTPPTDTVKVWAFFYDGTVIENYTEPYEPCANLQSVIDAIDTLCAKWDIVICEKPGTIDGDTREYVNDDDASDIVVSLGTGEMKWILDATAEPDAFALTEFMRTCIQNGSTVSLSWVDVDGDAGSATVIGVSGGPTDYLLQTQGDAVGTDVTKLNTANAVCNNGAAAQMVIKTYDACVESALMENTACLQDIKAELQCPPNYGPQCFFFSYATTDADIASIAIGATDISTRFALPIDAQSQPDTLAMVDIIEQCLQSRGYFVTRTTGRDGWKLVYEGEPVVLSR